MSTASDTLADRATEAREKSSARAEEARRRWLGESAEVEVYLDNDLNKAHANGVPIDVCVGIQTLRVVQAIHALMLPIPEDDDNGDDTG